MFIKSNQDDRENDENNSSHVLQASETLFEGLFRTCTSCSWAWLLSVWGETRAGSLILWPHRLISWHTWRVRRWHIHSRITLRWRSITWHSTAGRHTARRGHLRWHARWRSSCWGSALVLSHRIEINELRLWNVLRNGTICAANTFRRWDTFSEAVSM